jgi:hypothetical protein
MLAEDFQSLLRIESRPSPLVFLPFHQALFGSRSSLSTLNAQLNAVHNLVVVVDSRSGSKNPKRLQLLARVL